MRERDRSRVSALGLLRSMDLVTNLQCPSREMEEKKKSALGLHNSYPFTSGEGLHGFPCRDS